MDGGWVVPFPLTLEESLAGVFLEKGFMSDRSSKIVDHELKDGFDLGFGISGVVGQGGVLSRIGAPVSLKCAATVNPKRKKRKKK